MQRIEDILTGFNKPIDNNYIIGPVTPDEYRLRGINGNSPKLDKIIFKKEHTNSRTH